MTRLEKIIISLSLSDSVVLALMKRDARLGKPAWQATEAFSPTAHRKLRVQN